MNTKVGWSIGVAMVVTGLNGFAWTDLGGGDHGGSNWVIAGGATIASNHYNIGTVTIATGTTVSIKSYSGGQYGWSQITASNITISGTLDATGAGYVGGYGGSGGNGSSVNSSMGASGTAGAGGTGPFAGVAGALGAAGVANGNGGTGGIGGSGGYATNGLQGDMTTNEVLNIGSGGGGGGGGGSGYRYVVSSSGGGGGGAGNAGGGYIMLISSNTITIRGMILACGKAAGNGQQGQTGAPGLGAGGGSPWVAGQSQGGSRGEGIANECYPAGHGGNGGSGAGGGILIKAPTVDVRGASIDNRGGGNNVANGGTLKIFYIDYQGGSLTNSGRTYMKQMLMPEAGTVFEF